LLRRLGDDRGGNHRILLELVLDVVALVAVFYFVGGAGNPLVSLLLLPIVAAAYLLPQRLSMLLTVGAICAYTVLLFEHSPVDAVAPRHMSSNLVHVLGMWISFVLSAMLVTVFVGLLAGQLRAREHELRRQRELAARDEQLVALGTQAASVVHELATPLTSIALLVETLQSPAGELDPALREDLGLIEEQVGLSVAAVRRLSQVVEDSYQDSVRKSAAGRFVAEAVARFGHYQPGKKVCMQGGEEPTVIDASLSLLHALISLISNAADADSDIVRVSVEATGNGVEIRIVDWGDGFPPDVDPERSLLPLPSHKHEGQGLGLFLARASIERAGGTLRWTRGTEGMTAATIGLPGAAA
ncbi:MAG: HAMP domain-containing histidine kinase, partial [Gammaproteobacteria bacterium]|nr:HAMP domain-containing histidine kinase [Gammaproteobacteria bacterium]